LRRFFDPSKNNILILPEIVGLKSIPTLDGLGAFAKHG
jgi:hypothetical protein